MTTEAAPSRNSRWLVWACVAGALLLVAGANAHLLYVSINSQPDCVAHSRIPGEGPGYSAAKSAC